MNLKTTPFEAIKIIDNRIAEGNKILITIEVLKRLSDNMVKKEKIRKKQEKDEDVKKSIDKLIKDSALISNLKSYQKMYKAWEAETIEKLDSIYKDYTPKFRFSRAQGDYFLFNEKYPKELNEFLKITGRFEKQLNFLVENYQELIKFSSSPLLYLEERATIVYYDRIEELEIGSNQAKLCKCMFSFPVGSAVKFETIYAKMFNFSEEEIANWDNKWKRTIISAYEDVNKKTNKKFGFNIFKTKSKKMIYINVPIL